MSVLEDLAAKYNVNITKPNFPVNTMRLFYLLLTYDQTQGNEEAIEKVNQAIPKISAVLDARDMSLTSKAEDQAQNTPETQMKACQPALTDLFRVIDTPQLRQTVQLLFSDVYPVQESLLSSIDHFLKQDKLEVSDLMTTLRIRAMDSMLYAGVLDEIIGEFNSPVGKNSVQYDSLYSTINAVLQINDLVDGIVYAKQDLASKAATLVEIIRRVDSSNDGIAETVKYVFTSLETHIPDPNTHHAQFVHKLVEVVGIS